MTTTPALKTVLKVKPVTVEYMLNHEAKEYNEYEWIKKVKRFATLPQIQFYELIDSSRSYESFYACYEIEPEGILFFNHFGYGASITNNGFCKVYIDPNNGEVMTGLFEKDGNVGRLVNDKMNRKYMAGLSKGIGMIFSNCI